MKNDVLDHRRISSERQMALEFQIRRVDPSHGGLVVALILYAQSASRYAVKLFQYNSLGKDVKMFEYKLAMRCKAKTLSE
jgi:hypothetical protein